MTTTLPSEQRVDSVAQSPSPSIGDANKVNTLPSKPVVFFDGVCGMCNASVDFVLRHDRRGRLLFAPLQGKTASDLLHIDPAEGFKSLVLYDAGHVTRRSDAVWRVLRHLGGVFAVVGLFLRLVPPPLRNFGYDVVAHHRYRWFGKKQSCRLPTSEERSRFLP